DSGQSRLPTPPQSITGVIMHKIPGLIVAVRQCEWQLRGSGALFSHVVGGKSGAGIRDYVDW
ncbi:MAG: hypothetical protein DRR42_27425, partial [Gammaproteobacteria bacterium]